MKLLINHTGQFVKRVFVCGVLLALGITPVLAQGTSGTTLANLVNGGTLTIGDKTFSNFGWQASLADAAELNADAAGLNVSASIVNGIYYLDFSGGIAVNNLVGNAALVGDLTLTYTVTVNDPSQVIWMIDQNYTPNGLPVAGNQITIAETVRNHANAVVANSTLTLNPLDLSDPAPEAGDNLNITPGLQQLLVTKDILITAAPGQLLGLSDVQQSFHQVPEPSAMLLGGLVGGLLVFLRSRREARRD